MRAEAVATPALFRVDAGDVALCRRALTCVERRGDDVVWLRYRVEGTTTA